LSPNTYLRLVAEVMAAAFGGAVLGIIVSVNPYVSASALCGLLAFLMTWRAGSHRFQGSTWGCGRGPQGIGWAVYKNDERIDWACCHPTSARMARRKARTFARRERYGLNVPPYPIDGSRVVVEATIPRRDLREV
jgi:hypothetical protein